MQRSPAGKIDAAVSGAVYQLEDFMDYNVGEDGDGRESEGRQGFCLCRILVC